MISRLRQNFVFEKFVHGIGAYGMKSFIHRNTNSLLAITHTEGTPELNLIIKPVFPYQILKLLNNLTRYLDMT